MAWWDYGSQITSTAERQVCCDSKLANHTRIYEVAIVFISSEERAFKIARKMGADYIVVVVGGFLGARSSELSQLSWMIQFANKIGCFSFFSHIVLLKYR